MLTSIRGITAATFSAGLLLSAAPAFASETASPASAGEDMQATEALNNEAVETEGVLADTSAIENEVSVVPMIAPAKAPVDDKSSNSIGAESPITISGNVAFATEYRFRGVALTDGEFAIQGGFDVNHSSGFYVGTWGSNLDEQTVGYGSTELDIYGGWSGTLIGGLSADFGVIGYLYPDAGPGQFDYVEFYGSATFGIGPGSVTAGIAYAPEQDSLGMTDNTYIYAGASVGLPNTPITLNAQVGYTEGFLTFTTDSEAVDWMIGADLALGPVTLNASYVGVEGDPLLDPNGTFTDDAFVVSLSASF
ncbi:MAG: TorF family putative porin [Pseudomonadota bacterium]